MDITNQAQALQPYLVSLREAFHSCPETAGEESKTAQRIVDELEKIGGYTITTQVGGHGVLAEIQGPNPGPTLVFRADMDALNIQEETELSCASTNPGKMHACGHDFHVTMLLGGAKLIKEQQAQLKGTIRLCFQPSEECTPKGGSRDMIEGGALKNADAVFGLHVWPDAPSGKFGIRPGPLMAASDRFFARFKGRASHAARPHEGVDALVAGAQFITTVQTLISRNKNPLHDGVITMGKCVAGSAYNIVPEHCTIEGTCRTFLPEDRALIETR
ncbi:MAG: M20 family metallopeptidase, partial [Eubacteriales bacterium]